MFSGFHSESAELDAIIIYTSTSDFLSPILNIFSLILGLLSTKMSAAFKGMILYPLVKKKMGELLPLKGNTLDCCRSEICRSDTCWRTFVVSHIKKYVVVRIPARGIYSLSGETGHF